MEGPGRAGGLGGAQTKGAAGAANAQPDPTLAGETDLGNGSRQSRLGATPAGRPARTRAAHDCFGERRPPGSPPTWLGASTTAAVTGLGLCGTARAGATTATGPTPPRSSTARRSGPIRLLPHR